MTSTVTTPPEQDEIARQRRADGPCRKRRLLRLATALLLVTVAAPRVRAADFELTPLTYDWTVDGIVTGAAAAATITLLLMKNDLAPLDCKWCEPGKIDGDLSKSVAWSNPHTANTMSDIMQFVVPAGMMGFGLIQGYRAGSPSAAWSDVMLITQATSLAMLVNAAVKYAVGRSRPYVWQGRPDLYSDPYDANLSFFSGHTTFVFAVAASAGTLFLMQGMPGAGIALGLGLGAAAFTGYLRMAADQHYLTDVLVAAAVGGLVGWAVPAIFHRPRQGPPEPGAVTLAPGGIAIAW